MFQQRWAIFSDDGRETGKENISAHSASKIEIKERGRTDAFSSFHVQFSKDR